MPKEFWLVTYYGLVWDRTILGFVPQCLVFSQAKKEHMEKYWYLSEAEAKAQVTELHALKVKADVSYYSLGSVTKE